MADNNEPVIAAGLTMKQWAEMLCSEKAKRAKKALDYLDGDQYDQMAKTLSDPHKGHKDWQARGFVPRFFDFTKDVVTKSARLFKDAPPMLHVYKSDTTTEITAESEALYTLMHNTEWIEVFANLDETVRLLKTALLLVQWDTDENRLFFNILHRANTAVVLKPNSRKVEALVHTHGENGFRVMTEEQYISFVCENDQYRITDVEPNPYGVVPVVEFYDTQIPRSGFWVDGGHDLVEMNELVNKHIIDSEYCMRYMKSPALYSNCLTEGSSSYEVSEVGGKLSSQAPTGGYVLLGGPDSVIQIQTPPGGQVYHEFLAPDVDLSPMDSVVEGWMKQCAANWAVNVHLRGEGRAESGYQLIVEEVDNLTLRQQRQKMFEAGFKRFFQVLKKVVPGKFTEDAYLFAEFPAPILPVNPKENEEAWSMKIDAGRATNIDYFMKVEGLSRAEAEAKDKEIREYNERMKATEPEPVVAEGMTGMTGATGSTGATAAQEQ